MPTVSRCVIAPESVSSELSQPTPVASPGFVNILCCVERSFSVIDEAIFVSIWEINLFSKPLFSIKNKAIDMQMNLFDRPPRLTDRIFVCSYNLFGM